MARPGAALLGVGRRGRRRAVAPARRGRPRRRSARPASRHAATRAGARGRVTPVKANGQCTGSATGVTARVTSRARRAPTSIDRPAQRRPAHARCAELLRVSPVIDELGARFRRPGERDRPGRRPGARRAARPAAQRPRLHHLGTARGHRAAAHAAGPTRSGTWAATSAPIGCRKGDWQIEITTYRSDELRPDLPQAGGRLRRHRSTATWAAATSRSTRWRCAARAATFVDPYGGLDDLADAGAAHPRTPGGLVRRRPAADDAGRPVRRAARLHRRPGGRRRR